MYHFLLKNTISEKTDLVNRVWRNEMLGTVPFANSHRGDSGRIKYNKDKRAAGVDKTSIKCLQFRMPAHDNMPTSNPPEKVHDILSKTLILEY